MQVAFPGPLQPPSQEPCGFVTHMIHSLCRRDSPRRRWERGRRAGGVAQALGTSQILLHSDSCPEPLSEPGHGFPKRPALSLLDWTSAPPLPRPSGVSSLGGHSGLCRPCGPPPACPLEREDILTETSLEEKH